MPVRGKFRCAPGELLALVGPSGAGKTSLLRILAGLMRPQQGVVRVDGETWCDTANGVFRRPQQRHVGLVFQHYALMPHLSALDNVAMALLHLPRAQRHAQAAAWLERVHLSADQQQRRARQLSGGQQQRVALARALAREPRLVLLDEPFSAVDQLNRQSLYELLAELRAQLHVPVVLVTHDLNEARWLADQMVVMDGGDILQQGTPRHIYRAPRNDRVANLVGIQNRFAGRWDGPAGDPGWGWLTWLPDPGAETGPALRLRVPDKGRIDPGQHVTWVIQSDGLHLLSDATQAEAARHAAGDDAVCAAVVLSVQHLGEVSLAQIAVTALPGVVVRLTVGGPGRTPLAAGQPCWLQLDAAWVHVMPTRRERLPDAEARRRLGRIIGA